MNADNAIRRDIKLHYEQQRAHVRHACLLRHAALDTRIDTLRTESNRCAWLMRIGRQDCTTRLQEIAAELAQLRADKADTEYDCQQQLIQLKREMYNRLAQHEQQLAQQKGGVS